MASQSDQNVPFPYQDAFCWDGASSYASRQDSNGGGRIEHGASEEIESFISPYQTSRARFTLGQPRDQRQRPIQDRMALLIDGANLFYAAAALNIEIDYLHLLEVLTQGRSLLRSHFYTGVDPKNDKQHGFLSWLSRHGYRVISKSLASSPEGTRRVNLQVEIAVDMLRLAEHCSTITLLTGDGHLAYAINALSRQGTLVEVVGLQSMTSDSLIDLADRYIDLATLQADIKKQ